MWEWANQDLPERRPDNEDGGQFEEQRRRAALAHNFLESKKRKSYNKPEGNQEKEAKADNLTKKFEKYLGRSRSKRQKAPEPPSKTGQRQDLYEHELGSEDLCKLMDQARKEQEIYKGRKCNIPPSGLTCLNEFVDCPSLHKHRLDCLSVWPSREATRRPTPGDEGRAEGSCMLATSYSVLIRIERAASELTKFRIHRDWERQALMTGWEYLGIQGSNQRRTWRLYSY